jgi:hypothetical protein
MTRTLWAVWTGAVLALVGGCASGPLLDNPLPLTPAAEVTQNPLYVPLGPTFDAYRKVFTCAQTTLLEFGFEILESNQFEGRIETLPRTAPGVLRPFKSGSPGFYDRVLETVQSYRHRAVVLVQPADNGGYWIRVTVFKELEDLPRPVRSVAGAANFRVDNNVERTFEVIDPTVFEASWIPRGQDVPVEQVLLARMKKCL